MTSARKNDYLLLTEVVSVGFTWWQEEDRVVAEAKRWASFSTSIRRWWPFSPHSPPLQRSPLGHIQFFQPHFQGSVSAPSCPHCALETQNQNCFLGEGKDLPGIAFTWVICLRTHYLQIGEDIVQGGLFWLSTVLVKEVIGRGTAPP